MLAHIVDNTASASLSNSVLLPTIRCLSVRTIESMYVALPGRINRELGCR